MGLISKIKKPIKESCSTGFHPNEETKIFELVLRFADKCVPLSRQNIAEAASIYASNLPSFRKEVLSFKDGVPGEKWVRKFYARHMDLLKTAIQNAQEGKQFRDVNAENLTQFAQLYALKTKHGISAHRIWNLDETRVSSGRDSQGIVRHRRFLRRLGASDAQLTSFS